MASKFLKVDVTEIDNSIKVVIVESGERFLLQRGKEDPRWCVFTIRHGSVPNGRWLKDQQVDVHAYSNDIIEKIQLGMY